MAGLAEQFVGRAAELAALDRAVAALEGTEPGALLVLGEPGIGKTRLLAELSARADARGFIVLAGSASELERDLPFWVFVDALDEYVAGVEPRRLASLDPGVRAELAQILPSLSGFGRGGRVALQDERYRAHRAVRELIERLAATRPVVLMLDDVHWADDASTELLGALLRRPPAARILLAVAARPRQLPARLAGALDRADRAGSLTRLTLGGLDREEADELVGEGIEDALAASLYEESGGNPFYLEQLARSPHPADAGADARALELGGVRVPPAVAAALTEELGLLSSSTRALLDGAAGAGDPVEPELAAAAAAVDEQAAAHALDELLTVELVRRTSVPRRFRFRHPIVRRAVYESAPGGWLLGAHERCAGALEQRGASAATRAHHVEQAARHGDATAVAVLRDAGQAAALRAPASAARWFGAALRLLPESAPPQERVELLMARAGALAATGQLDAGHAVLLESIELMPDEAVAMRVRLTVACAGVEHMLGRHAESRARIMGALERLPDAAAPEAVALMIVLAFDGLFRADFDAMRDAAGRALAEARPLGDRSLTATAAAVLTLACAWGGAIEAAEAARAEAAPLVDAMSDEELAGRIDAPAYLAAAELYMDRYEEASAHADRALSLARATGQSFPTLVPTLATAHLVRGRLAEAAELIDGGVESSRLANNVQDLAWRLHIRSSAALAAGDLDTALRCAEEAVELTRELDENFISAYPGMGLAEALLSSGDAARAVEVLVGAAGGEELPLIPGGWRTCALELLARCYLELGRREDAARAAALVEATAAGVRLPSAVGWTRRAAAAVALDAGEPAAAAELALASAAAIGEAGAVVEAALSRTLAGRALAQAGDPARAVTELEQAAAELGACGALRHRDAAERELRKLGRHIQRRTARGAPNQSGVAALSERERQVAQLVVDRKTNREIAGELFVSLKTVEAHMRNLFRKLEVSSRVEVARVVERAERAKMRG
jgi:DNA-binding NarL/FixJ family response regulator